MISGRLLSILALGFLFFPSSAHAEKPREKREQEFRRLLSVEPSKRTKEQRERIRDLWRNDEVLKKANDWFEILKKGDSVLDFPGMIAGKRLRYQAEEKSYVLSEIIASTRPEEDTWEKLVIFSEDGIVIRKGRLKMNSR